MKASTILRMAAQMVEEDRCIGGCFAIGVASNTIYHQVRASALFREYFFRPTDSGYWWPYKPAHGPRIIGLCLAAAIAESEGD